MKKKETEVTSSLHTLEPHILNLIFQARAPPGFEDSFLSPCWVTSDELPPGSSHTFSEPARGIYFVYNAIC